MVLGLSVHLTCTRSVKEVSNLATINFNVDLKKKELALLEKEEQKVQKRDKKWTHILYAAGLELVFQITKRPLYHLCYCAHCWG